MNKERLTFLVVALVILLCFSFVLLEYNALVIHEINEQPITGANLIIVNSLQEKSIYYSNPQEKDLNFEYFVMAILILLLILAFITLRILKNYQKKILVRGI